jgi:hypothetical protein
MHKIQIKTIGIGIGILFLTCLLGCLAYGIGMRIASEVWLIGVERAACRVGAAPTLNGIAEYIVETVQTGMPREQVEQILGALAPIEVVRGALDEKVDAGWGPTACDELWLKLTSLPGHAWRMFACYDRTGGLVHLESADPDYPLLGISAPIQR